jgi:DNA-binding NarL/FixJ family response regulator
MQRHLMNRSLTVLLADDHQVVRQALRALLGSEPDLQVVGDVGDGLQVAAAVESLQPDVLVVDLMMPGLSGLDATREVARRFPATRIVVLSMYCDDAYVVEALRNGASGYVLKDASAQELVAAIRAAAEGRHYLSAPFSQQPLETYLQKAKETRVDPYDTLTAREREVLHLAAEGLSNAEMAARLHISPRTAETHRASVLRKLRLKGQTDLVRFALRRGILRLD